MIYIILLVAILYALNIKYKITPIKFGKTDSPDTYKFSNDIKTEFIVYDGGFIISGTSPTISDIDVYKPETDTVEKGKGLKRKSIFYIFTKKVPFIKENYTLKRTIPIN